MSLSLHSLAYLDPDDLRSVVEHVFFPPNLPHVAQREEVEHKTNVALCHILKDAAAAFRQYPPPELAWARMERMIEYIQRAASSPLAEANLADVLAGLVVDDVFVMHIRAQNAAVLVRVLVDHVRFEIFEVSPLASVVMSTSGKILCSYPGPAIQVFSSVFADASFRQELASFLTQMDIEALDKTVTEVEVERTVHEIRETAHPRYISGLLVGILRGFGQPASVDRITKRIADEVLWKEADQPWRRSPLWLVIRVALQTSLDRDMYKTFILFFHAYLLQICIQPERVFPSETLHLMRIKMARRLSKLDPRVPNGVFQVVNETAKKTEVLLQDRWTSFQTRQSTSPPWDPSVLDFDRDTTITLNNSRPYLINALQSTSGSYSPNPFSPSHQPRLDNTTDFRLFSDVQLRNAVTNDGHIALADFELCVERHLDDWVKSCPPGDDPPDLIASCFSQYISSARHIYGTNPEENSIMILTCLDLWKALDTLAIRQCPLLKSYSPEIPQDFLHHLLLHRSSFLERAELIEKYISQRHNDAFCPTPIFSDDATETSFAARYYRTSSELQRLHESIKEHAGREREKKRAELRDKSAERQSLLDKAPKMSHDHDGSSWDSSCEKCLTDYKANYLWIHFHEWPLPKDLLKAQSVVFELSPPRAFSAWREITYAVLHDFGKPNDADHAEPKRLLDDYCGLRDRVVRHKYSRITIASTTLALYDDTHKGYTWIPAEESKVLLDNALSFRLYDRTTNSWAGRSFQTSSWLCTPPIPASSPYGKLHSFVSGTSHTSNEVIAAQADCPLELSLHEYMAFAGLRSGPRLQWLNIAREVPSPSLSFHREEVHTLITQAAWQIGPSADGVREWHLDLENHSFGKTLLHELDALIGRIEANWKEEVTIRTIALLTSRLLSSAQDSDICQTAYGLLRKARSVAYKWIGELRSKLDETHDEVSRDSLGRRLCFLAATCFSTFDVCPKHVPRILSSDLDFAVAVYCAVIVHDNTPPTLKDDDSVYLSRLLKRHRRLLYFLEPFLHSGVQSNQTGFDEGITKLWPDFRRQNSSNWHTLPSPNSRWITCTVGGGQEVHYNLLAGKLLLGGEPLGTLPLEVMKHSTFASVLGARILDAGPSDIPDMKFRTISRVSGYQLYFALRGGDLILKARGPIDSPLLQLIPRHVFADDFPKDFVDNYVHWLDPGTGEVEFRPVESPWTPNPSNWRLYVHTNVFRRIPGDGATPVDLIDIRSASFQMVSSSLLALESSKRIIITRTKQALEASLPRLRLVFFVNPTSELECRSMPGYVIDKNQSSGTMFGLENQLVLCPSKGSADMPRRVIIPLGEIKFGLDDNFSTVSISTGSERKVRWHDYTIDTDLRRLTGNVSLRSKLYQCYLHALTSHCLPDPLLGHTGTEESFNILQSAALLSFQRLSEFDANLLKLISELTPPREHSHSPSMTKVLWNDLPVLSQYHDFHPAVLSVINHAQSMEELYDKPGVFWVPHRQESLLNRAASRNRVYYPHDLQISRYSSSSSPKDIEHRSRDAANGGRDEHAAYQMSWSAWNAKPYLPRKWLNLWDQLRSWGSIGPSDTRISLRYSRYWLSFDVAKDWLSIYDVCQKALSCDSKEFKIKLAFSLSAASFSGSDRADIVPLFLIFATDPRFRRLTHPPVPYFKLSDDTSPDRTRLESIIYQSRRSIGSTPVQTMDLRAADREKADSVREDAYFATIDRKKQDVAESILKLWPEREGYPFLLLKSQHYDLPQQWFDTERLGEMADDYMESISRNIEFGVHIANLQVVLNSCETTAPIANATYTFSPQFSTRPPKVTSPSLQDVLSDRANVPQSKEHLDSLIQGSTSPSLQDVPSSRAELPQSKEDLDSLIQEFQGCTRLSLLRLYGDDLRKSYNELLGKPAHFPHTPSPGSLRHHRDHKDALFSEIKNALAPDRKLEKVVSISGLWPRITPQSILRELSRNRVGTLADPWKCTITRYAVAFLKYQQSQRMLELSSQHRNVELLREAETSCEEIAAACSPDWLLIQIDGNFLARQLQLDIAREMISPSCGRNASFHLNTGEGKSSVIVPFVAATLADGSKLARIVTLKPLSNQTFDLLLSRLSGLANRRIFFVPFYRNLKVDASLVQRIRTLYKQCVDEGGVLVVQPEHLLSQKLMCIDTLVTPQAEPDNLLTGQLEELQKWLAKVSRDVIDESDEILHVRYQLIYTVGEQKPVNDYPNRWSTTQQVFSLLQTHAEKLRTMFQEDMFELDEGQGGFPTMRILNQQVSGRISFLVANDALGGALSTLSLAVLSPQIRKATHTFITKKRYSVNHRDWIRSSCAGTTLWSGILLLRGLLVEGEGILGHVLKERRWRVDYGLDPSRTLLAVPYRAKDVPSLRAEFGHPDMAIALTCLSYYYGGLTKEQVLQCFDRLAKLDNPTMEYDQWVESGKEMDIPKSLQQFSGVNTDDDIQVNDDLVPRFRRNKRVIDFYLSQVVFPRAAKEFTHKLSSSAWDLVEDKSNVTTGFSGTNDNRYLLPTSITQEDPLSQLSTNALVLGYLLQAENNHYECTGGLDGERETAEYFLERVVSQDREIRVLLDVGAQMLELQNEDLVRHWLSLTKPHISAGIFFDDFDHLAVLTRDGTVEPFTSSPFHRQLDKCIVYLDDAHTRGTDLKFPRETRAAVTLGPKVTKDRLLQGCMRMRQLGKGQSVMFFAPGEVDRRIHDLIPTGEDAAEGEIRVVDILRWAMHETCEDIARNLPQWAQQGLDHGRRFKAYQQCLFANNSDVEILKSAWLQPEARTLEQMYDPTKTQGSELHQQIKDVPSLQERMGLLEVTKLTEVGMDEEQEREVNNEAKQERQVERPPKAEPTKHTTHQDIVSFVLTGNIPPHSTCIIPLLAPTGIDKALDSSPDWSLSPRSTLDFATTTRCLSEERLTDYLRPVNWVVSSGFGKDSVAIVISPYEANELLPEIRKSDKVRLHTYAPKVTASMRSFSDLTFHTISKLPPTKVWTCPSHIRMGLNLFAGQLYFDSKEEYDSVCVLFALKMAHLCAKEIDADGFVHPRNRTGKSSPLSVSAIATIKRLMNLRRKGMGYDKTQIGRVLDVRPLKDSDFTL